MKQKEGKIMDSNMRFFCFISLLLVGLFLIPAAFAYTITCIPVDITCWQGVANNSFAVYSSCMPSNGTFCSGDDVVQVQNITACQGSNCSITTVQTVLETCPYGCDPLTATCNGNCAQDGQVPNVGGRGSCCAGTALYGGICRAPVNGVCATNSDFAYDYTGAPTYCTSGDSSNTPVFSAGATGGETLSWTCYGQYGGSSSVTCYASKVAAQSCLTPWGATIAHYTNVTYYLP